ncbi:MAG: hypothetical protein WD398_10500 [Cyclobacteriaceae bacterium]
MVLLKKAVSLPDRWERVCNALRLRSWGGCIDVLVYGASGTGV